MVRKRGRPKGTTGKYPRWSGKKIAVLNENAELISWSEDEQPKAEFWNETSPEINEKLPDKRRLAHELNKKYPHITEERLRQVLSRDLGRGHPADTNSEAPKAERDKFTAELWSYLLGED
jgi:hypothetical protein